MAKKYRFSTEIGSFLKELDYFQTITLLKKVGFDCYDLSLFGLTILDRENQTVISNNDFYINKNNYKDYCASLRKHADELGIVCNQAHAPFPTCFKGMEEYINIAIECASICGAEYIVIHPNNNYLDEENAVILTNFVEYAKKFNIKIATENMWNWTDVEKHALKASCSSSDSFVHTIDLVNSPNLVACLDIGHAEMMKDGTNAVDMIKKLGHNRLKCLHIHDNDKTYDNHQIPFSMNIDFSSIAHSLKEIKYDGVLTLEADRYISTHPDLSIEEKAKNLYLSLKKFKSLIK